MLVVVRVKGRKSVNQKLEKLLNDMGLNRKFTAVLLEDSEFNKKKLSKVKDLVMIGSASEKVVESFKNSRVLRLHPPVKGFKGSVKKPFPRGVTGFNKNASSIVERMLNG
jgi:ribosomal protein L30/L7E